MAKVPENITKVRHEQLLVENSSVWQSNHTRPHFIYDSSYKGADGFCVLLIFSTDIQSASNPLSTTKKDLESHKISLCKNTGLYPLLICHFKRDKSDQSVQTLPQ